MEADYYSDGMAGTVLAGKDFGCESHWEAKECFDKSKGGVNAHIELMTGRITWAKNPEWIGQIYDEAKHRAQDELKEKP